DACDESHITRTGNGNLHRQLPCIGSEYPLTGQVSPWICLGWPCSHCMLNAANNLHYWLSVGLLRIRLTSERTDFACSRLRLEASVGRVATRALGTCAPATNSPTSRSSASARFIGWSRCELATMTITPSLVMRRPASEATRRFMASGILGELARSHRSCTGPGTL